MQPMWLCMLHMILWWNIWKDIVEKINATYVTIPPMRHALWKFIWKCITKKNQTNAASVSMHPLGQVLWGRIWKYTEVQAMCWLCLLYGYLFEDWGLRKKTHNWVNQRNAANVTMHAYRQVIWRDIRKYILEKNLTNADKCRQMQTLPPLIDAIWGLIWKYTVEKCQINAIYVIMQSILQAIWRCI